MQTLFISPAGDAKGTPFLSCLEIYTIFTLTFTAIWMNNVNQMTNEPSIKELVAQIEGEFAQIFVLRLMNHVPSRKLQFSKL